MYHFLVKQLVNQSLSLVNKRHFHTLVGSMALNGRHSFAGAHALGGVRNDQATVKAWLDRLMPTLQIPVNHINVAGWPHNTLAIVRGTATAILENGDPYLNKGVHFITLKWGKVIVLEVHKDTLAAYTGLEKQYRAGIQEARAPQIIS